jgi:acyl dehydratase
VLKKSEISVGSSYTEQVVSNLTRTQIVQYAGVSGDYNPIHIDETFAVQKAAAPTVFAHGLLTMGLTGKMLTNYVGDNQLRGFGLRLLAQVWPGDTLEATAVITSIEKPDEIPVANFDVTTTNQHGVAVAKGTASASIDPQ